MTQTITHPQTYHTALPTPTNDALMLRLTEYVERKARINGETVPCRVVDVDVPDNRVYVKTHADSMTFALPLEAVTA